MHKNESRIAIVGIGLRAPGGATDLDRYETILRSGQSVLEDLHDVRRAVFAEEWDSTLTRGGYLENVFDFDARFFAMSPREARVVDPQQRLLLEVAWEAFEDAAILPADVADGAGVFVGITGQDYRRWFIEEPTAHWTAGNGLSFAAGRLAHLLGLTGPAASIDTACSSSLVAMYSGCRALAFDDCDLAVVAGVNLILAPWTTRALQRTGALSPDGESRPFDAAANGYVRGEGCAAVLLKRLDDAVRNGDRIHGVIDSIAMNHDGGGAGFSAPNGRAQVQVIRRALSLAGLKPHNIGYHEAHGTGTPLGDRVELTAIREGLSDGRPLPIGSVKAIVGHAEAASGLLSVVKAILSLRERCLFPQSLFKSFPSDVDLSGSGIWIPREETEWPDHADAHVSVSSFGMSGTNVSVILSEAPKRLEQKTLPSRGGFMVTAASPDALREVSRQYILWLNSRSSDSIFADFTDTATTGRTRLAHTYWVRSDEIGSACEALKRLARGERHPLVDQLRLQDHIPEGAPRRRRPVSLPKYPWQRQNYSIRSLGA